MKWIKLIFFISMISGLRPGCGGISSGYVSEPEHNSSYLDKSATLDSRRRFRNKENDFSTATLPRQ